jgi:hypothetical protein
MIINTCNKIIWNNNKLEERRKKKSIQIFSIIEYLLQVIISLIQFEYVEEMVRLIETLIIIDFLF